MCIRDRDKCVENIRVKDDNDIVVNAKINGCVREVLFDSGAQISLIDEHFLTKHKHCFKKIPILPVNNKIVISATCESQVVRKQALITIYTQGVEIEVPILVKKKNLCTTS